MMGSFLKLVLIIAIISGVFLVGIVVKYRSEGDRLYARYAAYTQRVLDKRLALQPYPVKEQYRIIHPWKALKLIRIAIDSNEGERFRRLNILDATMFFSIRMFTLFILPDYRYNLPMLSVDIIFIGGKRIFIIEVIDPAGIEDENLAVNYEKLRAWKPEVDRLEHAEIDMEWCKDIVTDFSIHSKADRSKDDLLFDIYKSFLNTYLDMTDNARELNAEDSLKVQQGMEGYVGALLAKGGPAVDVFKVLLGKKKQHEYVRAVMFGVD
ncbi:MAG: hypothetical protein GY868_00050 [Deltaproteobacteria bacterium]|nr:hypothetical protein [Deltaproteobacteria bacterium]